jgi:pyruvate dehydrogenase E2 component (dihydrolipoamide acetyltransferase)
VQEFKVPELGENVSQGDVAKILVKVGDTIAREQPVLELETDKATIEVPSSVAGIVKEIKVKQGDKVTVGSVILTVDENGLGAPKPPAEAAAGADAAKTAEPATAGAQDAQPPAKQSEPAKPAAEQESQPEQRPDQPEQRPDQKVVSMSRPPSPAPQTSARQGQPEAPRASGLAAPKLTSEAPRTGGPATPKLTPEAPRAGGPATPKPEARAEAGPAAPASPSVRRLAREIGVDVNEVHGSGPDGRISQEDVKEHARRILSSVGTTLARGSSEPATSVPLPDFEKWGPIERQPMSNIRRKTAEHLSHAWTTIPHVTQFDKADITPMEELRAKFREQVEKAGGNLTVTAVLVKVLAAAVKQFPQFNASLDAGNNAIIYKKYVNVGVAVDTEYGLLVPVIRDADQKNITQIAVEMHQLSEKARAKKLSLDEMRGGGISISNLGGIGGTYFTPIVNWPEVAILGVSRGIVEPRFILEGQGGSSSLRQGSGEASQSAEGATAADPNPKRPEGRFEPRQLLPLSLSYDHRVIDGADAMRFLRWVVEAIEQPFILSLLG